MTLFFLIVFGIYFALVIALLTGLYISTEQRPSSRETIPHRMLSVIIPIRNEATSISNLLESLSKQSYPSGHFEIRLVNDHSEDDSVTIVNQFCLSHLNVELLYLPENLAGKKQALCLGIENSTGEIIVTTDADCVVSASWLESINQAFTPKTMMCIGGVRVNGNGSLFSQLQSMEFSSLIGSAAATLAFGYPTMCNGANLAFRKQAFKKVNGYADNFDIASGDDEFLMRKINSAFPGSIVFLNDSSTIVTTVPHQSLKGFIQQRIRWAGKWKFNRSVPTILLALFVFIFQASFLILIILTAVKEIDNKFGLLLIGGKLLLEFLFLYQVGLFLKTKWHWPSFILLQFLYPIYVLSIGLLAQSKLYVWKERKVAHKKRGV